MKLIIPLFAFLVSLFSGCLESDLVSHDTLKPEECQSCHLSPPPTGDHEFHLFKQTRRAQITCDECHASSVKNMHWIYILNVELYHVLQPWDNQKITDNTLTLVKPLVDTLEYLNCFHEIKGDTLYTATLDSFTRVEKAPGPKDSVVFEGDSWRYFSWQSSEISIDTGLGNIIDTIEINFFKEPVNYSVCDFTYAKDTLFEISIVSFDRPLRPVGGLDIVIEQVQYNRLYIISASEIFIDTLMFSIVPFTQSDLNMVSESVLEQYSTIINNEHNVLVLEDSLFFQWKPDTLLHLQKDSLINFTGTRFADNTGFHGNGIIDIDFLHEMTTDYTRETVDSLVDSITGTVSEYLFETDGAWDVKRKSCWSSGIKAGQCHDGVTGETFWYKPPIVFPSKTAFKAPHTPF